MAAETDRLQLTNRKLFQIVRSAENNVSLKTKNIIECKDDILYVWNRAEKCILTLNIKTSNPADADECSHQTLIPTDPPEFDVERILVSETASYVAVVGPRGVAVLELPRRWGKLATFQGGKSVVSCRCQPVDQHFFACSPQVQARQARWHPGSPGDNHLLVLASDNTFRLYSLSPREAPRLCQVWPLGRTPGPALGTATRLSLLAGLGDTAVAFDFLHAVPSPPEHLTQFQTERLGGAKDQSDSTLWAILVLRGNGDVYSVTSSLSSEGSVKPVVQGPLAMHPSADDNYGGDACSILCLKSEPPVIVIATCSGTLYHCILMDKEDYDIDNSNMYGNKSLSRYGSTYSVHTPEVTLFVFESVELELGLFSEDNDDAYSCPLHLHHDIFDRSRYFCTHDTGVHMMVVPVVSQLDSFLHAVNDDDQHLPSLSLVSSAEYLICTRSSSSPIMPILGLTLSATPTMLVALMGSGEVVSLPLASSHTLPTFGLTPGAAEENTTQPGESLKEPFDEHIRSLLKHNLTQPILKIGPNADLNPKECMELISRTTQLLQGEYFTRHDKVRKEIEQRVETLHMLKEHQLVELEQMKREKSRLQQSAELLAERYEDIKDKQEELTLRAENISRLLSTSQPVISLAEKKLAEDLKQIESKVSIYKKSLEQVKAKQAYHKSQTQQWAKNKEIRDVYLAPAQLKTVKAILAQVTDGIADLRKLTNVTKRELGL